MSGYACPGLRQRQSTSQKPPLPLGAFCRTGCVGRARVPWSDGKEKCMGTRTLATMACAVTFVAFEGVTFAATVDLTTAASSAMLNNGALALNGQIGAGSGTFP